VARIATSSAHRHRRELSQGVLGAFIAGSVGAATSAFAAPSQAAWKLVVGSTAITVIGFLIGAATGASTDRLRVRWLASACALLTAFAVFTYWQLRRPPSAPPVASFTVKGTEVDGLSAHGSPGGPKDVLPPAPALVGGSTYLFECYSVVGAGSKQSVWLRLADHEYWYPLADLTPTPGVTRRSIPSC
jgi:hypothetical protein